MLIILFPYKFSNFFFKKYQINELIKKFKKNFEIHDISNIIAKNFHNELKRKNHKAIQVFDNINEWKTHIQKKGCLSSTQKTKRLRPRAARRSQWVKITNTGYSILTYI